MWIYAVALDFRFFGEQLIVNVGIEAISDAFYLFIEPVLDLNIVTLLAAIETIGALPFDGADIKKLIVPQEIIFSGLRSRNA